MTLERFIEQHKGVRRTVLAVCVVWASLAICVGLWVMVTRGLATPDTAFLTAVIALMQTPVGFYFWKRGQEECGRR
jgi:exosortase/archaeosortase